MPQKNTVKIYVENGFYHIYNRGVAKRKIFKNKQDYGVFLDYLKTALSPSPKHKNLRRVPVSLKGLSFTKVARQPKNFSEEIDLLCYCLMPNHFHLLIKQKTRGSMEGLMRSVITRYSMYFNQKYNRIGPLFQGTYKAVIVTKDGYLLHLSRYIHLNPAEHTSNLINAYSSYANYLGLKKTDWVKPGLIISFFNQEIVPELNKINTYKDFVEKYKKDSIKLLGDLILD